MKKTNLIFSMVAIGIFFGACSNKQIKSEKNENNEFYNEIQVKLKTCNEKEIPIKMDTNLEFLGAQYDTNDRYISEFIVCNINDTSVYVKLFEEFRIDGKSFTQASGDSIQLLECGKEKSTYLMNKKFMVCKINDDLIQVRVYRNLN